MKFVIHSPPWDPMSGGNNVLWNLGRTLSAKGHDAKIWVENMSGQESNFIYKECTDQVGFDEDTVVIYSEMIVGNPLHAKKIVRWVLYGAHMYDQYDPNEIIYYHSAFCQNHNPTQILRVVYAPPGLSGSDVRTNESCFALKKGHRNSWALTQFYASHPTGVDVGCLYNHQQCIETFKTTKYFHCYDPASFLIVMALMCGCIVIQHPYIEGQTREQWEHSACYGPGKIKGLVYGDEDLSYAEATIDQAPEQWKKYFEDSDSTVDQFINDMETGNYKIEPCYKFNESPYAYQHLYR
jgi:hypothetical protein